MYTLYKGQNLKEILLLLLKKARKEEYLINVVCATEEIMKEISAYLWNNNIPNWIKDDEFYEKNNIFVSVDIKDVQVIIIYDTAMIDQDLEEELIYKKYEKILIISTKHNLDGTYWNYCNKTWSQITKNEFYNTTY